MISDNELVFEKKYTFEKKKSCDWNDWLHIDDEFEYVS